MLLQSFDFIGFLGVTVLACAVAPIRFKPFLLLVASYTFYALFFWKFPIYLPLVTGLAYFGALLIEKSKQSRRRRVLVYSLLPPLGLFVFFKYFNLLVELASGIFPKCSPYLAPLDLILPVGLSFVTFKIVSYLVDVFRSRLKAEKNIVLLALHIAYFPQLLAGPIERAASFLPEIKKQIKFDDRLALSGIKLVIWGLFKKIVIADNLAGFVSLVFAAPENFSGLTLALTLVFFSFQIYCDFSGYSDIAIGISRIFGLQVADNFNFPYFSQSIPEFWTRWHISLSTWLRDYLFLPIAYAVMRVFKSERLLLVRIETLAYISGIVVTMFLCGAWHGANWTFVCWGLLHGFFLIASHAGKNIRKSLATHMHLKKLGTIRRSFRVLWTFGLVSMAWVFFASPTLAQAFGYLGRISWRPPRQGVGQIIYLAGLIAFFIVLEYMKKNRGRFHFYGRISEPVKWLGYALLLCLMIVIGIDKTNAFIYFSF